MAFTHGQHRGGAGNFAPTQKLHEIVSDPMKAVASRLQFSGPLSPSLFDTDAETVARELNEAKDKFNKPTQIRRFYDELVGWQERIREDDGKFKEFEAFIKMLNAKVAYAKGRELIDANFEHWFRACVAQTNSAKALTHFRLHFEAMLGFLKGLRG